MHRHFFYLFALLCVPLIVGCDGCRQTTGNSEESEDEKAPPEAYSTQSTIVYPTDQSATFGALKPGHWMTAEQSIRSNKADTRGELISQSSVTLKNVDSEVSGTRSSLETVRPVTLPKGQMRGFDFRFRVPIPNTIETRRITISSRLIPRSGGLMETGAQPFNVMSGSEYYFIVLTSRPDQFTRLQVANWVSGGGGNLDGRVKSSNYRVVVPDASGLLPLPETMLDLTSTAVIFWDDLSEDALTPLQQSAIADWIRFGGRLIVNGPEASDAIANTALADLLPLTPTSIIEMDGNAAVELLETHSVKTDKTLTQQIQSIRSESSRIAVDGQLDPAAIAVDGTGSLVLSKRLGRGTVIQPRFDVTSSWVAGWDSYDSFFNSVLLNRPPRRYLVASEDLPGNETVSGEELALVFVGTKLQSDAAVNTQLRLASRDSIFGSTAGGTNKRFSVFDSQCRVDAVTGLSAWTDSSDTLQLMRTTLQEVAGIEIPGSSLVIRSLAIYLIVLVPVNYLIFRLMNRLEYAWFAVPIIAIIGAAWAARQAQLDIGFARSNTEIAILEVHADYPRAHLTRMIGMYNSLSSRYQLQFPTVDGIAAPLEDEASSGANEESVLRVSFDEGPALANFAVPSNRMRFVHAEQMVDLGGSIRLSSDRTLTNGSDLELVDGIVVSRRSDGVTEVGLIGGLEPGKSKPLELRESESLMVATDLPMGASEMIRRFAAPGGLVAGETRLIARIDGILDGLQISPAASQHTGQTIAIVHLEHAAVRKAEPDQNLARDFRRVNNFDAEKSTQNDNDTGE